jgi:hypothetical protein
MGTSWATGCWDTGTWDTGTWADLIGGSVKQVGIGSILLLSNGMLVKVISIYP